MSLTPSHHHFLSTLSDPVDIAYQLCSSAALIQPIFQPPSPGPCQCAVDEANAFILVNHGSLTLPPSTDSSASKDCGLRVILIYFVAAAQGLSSRDLILLHSFLLSMKQQFSDLMEMHINIKNIGNFLFIRGNMSGQA